MPASAAFESPASAARPAVVGICDWGVGGLGFYGLLRAARPDLDVVYIGDQGVPGYGKLPRPALTIRLRFVLGAFRERGVRDVVVACNAASTVLDAAQVDGVRATGMIEPTLRALRRPRGDALQTGASASLGIIGGRRTILSGAYARPLRAAGYTVRNRIAQPLSGLIEAGDLAAARVALDVILQPLADVATLVLACTHYVVLAEDIGLRLSRAKLLDPATLAWREVAPTLPAPTPRRGRTTFLTSGDPALMRRTAAAAFGVDCSP
ncbi:MAG: aspartate/glutamate racemase family protein, partial [Pseudomonadota bacterium]|nr:aspartate/glutamate racemase family protein [Pseudomonadota bacterium]